MRMRGDEKDSFACGLTLSAERVMNCMSGRIQDCCRPQITPLHAVKCIDRPETRSIVSAQMVLRQNRQPTAGRSSSHTSRFSHEQIQRLTDSLAAALPCAMPHESSPPTTRVPFSGFLFPSQRRSTQRMYESWASNKGPPALAPSPVPCIFPIMFLRTGLKKKGVRAVSCSRSGNSSCRRLN